VGHVPVTDILPAADLENLRAPSPKGVDQGRVRILAEPIEVSMMEELLESRIDPIPTLS
jgi:hypothetical protein